jgi:hypothetical protein
MKKTIRNNNHYTILTLKSKNLEKAIRLLQVRTGIKAGPYPMTKYDSSP